MDARTPKKEPQSSFSGLYKNVKISVRTLDMVIIGGVLVIVLLLIFGIANNGYSVTFDSNGGTDVPSQTDVMYGDLLEVPEPPTREGYEFTGWYHDANCQYLWDFNADLVADNITLYAGWEKIE